MLLRLHILAYVGEARFELAIALSIALKAILVDQLEHSPIWSRRELNAVPSPCKGDSLPMTYGPMGPSLGIAPR